MLLARERVQQMKEEKKKQIEQKFAQLDEKTEKVRALGFGWPVPSWGPSRSDVGAQELRGDPSGSYGFVALDPFPVRHRGPGVGSEPGRGRKVSALDLPTALCGGWADAPGRPGFQAPPPLGYEEHAGSAGAWGAFDRVLRPSLQG